MKLAVSCLDITEEELDLYGKYKAKLSDELIHRIENNKDGKLVLVTAINPTPAGEGKTTVTVGLGQALGKMGKKASIALREPSLGPCFGIKGGAAGGRNGGQMRRMRRYGQLKAMQEQHWTEDDFRREFGKSYL